MKNIPTTPRIAQIKKERNIKRIRFYFLFFIILIFLVSTLSYISFIDRISINNIEIKGNNVIYSNDIKNIAENEINGTYLKLFSKSNFLIYPKNKIEKNILNKYKRIENIDIKRLGLNNLIIVVSERRGEYLFCGNSIITEENNKEKCYFLNDDGYIFDEAPYFSGDIYYKFYKFNHNAENVIGTSLYDKRKFHNLLSFIDTTSDFGLISKSLFFDSNNDYHMILKSNSRNNSEIIFNEKDDLSTILNNLYTALQNKEFSSQITTNYDNLLYIDLRFNNKVLYKFNEE